MLLWVGSAFLEEETLFITRRVLCMTKELYSSQSKSVGLHIKQLGADFGVCLSHKRLGSWGSHK
eukprot:c41264_g1_i1 orf=3-194(-)